MKMILKFFCFFFTVYIMVAMLEIKTTTFCNGNLNII